MPAALKTAYGVDIAPKYKWIHTQRTCSISCKLLHEYYVLIYQVLSLKDIIIHIIIIESKVRTHLPVACDI